MKPSGRYCFCLFHSHNTQDLNGRENTSLLINIVNRSLLRLYGFLQIERGPSRAGIAETGRQVACELIQRRKRPLDGAVYF